jgi:hypothetical protein
MYFLFNKIYIIITSGVKNMAHFAELSQANIVLRVVVIDNNDVIANGGDQSATAEKAVEQIVPFSKWGVKWVQTSYNNNFRKQYAGIGYTFDSTKINLSHLNLLHLGHLMLMTTGKHLLHIQQLQPTEIMLDTLYQLG